MHKLYDCSYPNVALFFKTKLFFLGFNKKKKTQLDEKRSHIFSSETVEA